MGDEAIGNVGARNCGLEQFLREVCAQSILAHPHAIGLSHSSRHLPPNLLIGGPGKTVEIDESVFSKRKFNVGRLLPEQWILGGVCREDKGVFMFAVPNRKKETLKSIIS